MALNDTQVFIPGQGRLYVAPVGTAVPGNLTAPAAPWIDLGHTSIEDGLTIGREGGDSEVLGTWQNPALRERRESTTWFVTVFLHQVSNQTLSFFFGGGDASVSGEFGVPLLPQAQERSLFIRIIDGSNEAPLFIPRVSLLADDDVELDVENLMAFPVRATVLGVTGSNLMTFYGADLGGLSNEVQSVAITGTPTGGSFTLTYVDQETGNIAYNASATVVQAALRALSNIGTGNVTCTDGPLPGSAVTVTFTGALAGTDISQLTADDSGLTGGTTPAVVITTTTPGG